MKVLTELAESVINGDIEKARELTKAAIAQKVPTKDILNQGLIAGMTEVGRRFREEEMFVPEVLLAARAMRAGMEALEPLLVKENVKPIAKAILGTVKGDIHEVGKNLVGIMLRGSGFQVIDIGVDVPPQKFLDAAKEHQAQLVCMSALLTTSLPSLATSVKLVKEAELPWAVQTMVGGAVVTPKYAQQIGASGYAPDAGAAVDMAKALLKLA